MSKDKGWYKRTHQFDPYTKADGQAVSDEFDAIQSSFNRIPEMRDDGKGFAVSPIIPTPTDPMHPVTYGMLTEAEYSVNNARDDVTVKAQQVDQNTQSVAANTLTATQKADTATQAAESAQSSQQAASNSENMARKWASNPPDEVVQGDKYSAYHYATKAAQSAHGLAEAETTAKNNADIAIKKAEEAAAHAARAKSIGDGEIEYEKVLNVPHASLEKTGVTKLSEDLNSTSDEEAATIGALNSLFIKVKDLQCNSIEQLRTIEPTTDKQTIFVKGYHAGSTKGGGYFMSDLSDNASADNAGTVIVTRGGKRWKRIADGLSFADFGVRLSSDNQTDIIQQALNVAAQAQQQIEFEQGEYIIDSLIIPSGSRLKTNNAIFRNTSATSVRVLTIQENAEIDALNLFLVGGSDVSGMKLCGNNIAIGSLSCQADRPSQYGVLIQSINGSQLTNICIRESRIKNFKSAMPIFNVQQAVISNITIEQYVTGVYLRDVSQSYFEQANIYGTSVHSSGGAGNNGLLIESTLSSGSSHSLHFIGWNVRESGEHAYRLGGQLSIQDVWFTNCRAGKTGNAKDNQATGGCGFKVLGATSVKGQWHRNIYFDNCHVEDVNTSAKGQGNFAGFLISNVDNIHITNCSVIANNYTYSSWHAYSFESVTNLFLSNNLSDKARQHAIKFVASTYAAHPGWEGIIRNVVIHGGSYSVFQDADSAAIYFTKDSGEAGRVSEINMSGTRIRGGVAAIRIESYYTPTDCYFDFSYSDPKSTNGVPPLLGAPVLCNIRSKWFGSYGSSAKDGSTFIDSDTGIVRERIAGTWQVKTPNDAKLVTLNAKPANNVETTKLLRARFSQIGNVVTLSGQLQIKPSRAGAIAVDLTLPVPATINSWADCAGTFNAVDASMHGAIAFDKSAQSIRLTGMANIAELRNCAFIASYLL